MAVLAAEVERGEAAAVPQVVVALAHLAQELAGAAEALPGGLVERSVAVLQCEKDRVESLDFSNIFMQKFVKLYNLGPPLIRDILLENSPGWWADTLGTYCPSRPTQLT